MTNEQISEIEKHFGGRDISDIQKTYNGFTVEQLYEIVESSQADNERRAQQNVLNERRQKEIEIDNVEARKQAETRFKAIAESRFMEANQMADKTDFERLYPQIRDEMLIENYRQMSAQKILRNTEIYEN